MQAEPGMLRILSDGTGPGTLIEVCTGEGWKPLSTVVKAEWSLDAEGLAECVIQCERVQVVAEVQGDRWVRDDGSGGMRCTFLTERRDRSSQCVRPANHSGEHFGPGELAEGIREALPSGSGA